MKEKRKRLDASDDADVSPATSTMVQQLQLWPDNSDDGQASNLVERGHI